MSIAELVDAGYPPRPDPAALPELYSRWLADVSKPTTYIRPHLVERDDVHFDPVSYNQGTIWSGSILTKSATRYVWSLGHWYVPTFSNPPGLTSSMIALWTGLDGYGVNALIQDGVYYNNVGGVGTYSAWYEYWPNAPVFNTNMTVSPTHEMTFWAWEGNSSCENGAGKTGYGCFWYKNETTNVTAGTFKVTAPNGSFIGKNAEAIFERVNGNPVSRFAPYPFIDYSAVDSASGWHAQTSDPYTVRTLVNASGQTLVAPFTFSGTNSVGFYWQQGQ